MNILVDLNEATRDPRENLLIQAGDVLVLQETQDEAITRYLTQTFRFNLFGRFINHADCARQCKCQPALDGLDRLRGCGNRAFLRTAGAAAV